MLQENDLQPPQLLAAGFTQPAPVPGEVNTTGAEDSPFSTPDGKTLYFFFTPDVRVPVEKQILDIVTGVYVSRLVDGRWTDPQVRQAG